MLKPDNSYTRMQLAYYDNEGKTGNMNRENHMQHNANPDYWSILVSDTADPGFKSKVGLDFGCGCGRNVMNLASRFQRMDGVDISPELIATSKRNATNLTNTAFHVCDGVSLGIFADETYDFVMSTIVLQHICVYDIRRKYLSEFFRVLRPGGLLSFQMGFGVSKYTTYRKYHDNFYQAAGTNSSCDVMVTDPAQVTDDLKALGFVDIQHVVRPSFADGGHERWIFVKASKPATLRAEQ